jgi:hypothetical protein
MVKKVLLGLSLIITLLTVLSFGFKANASVSGGVTVVPPKFELWGNPGEEVPYQSLKITNEENNSARLTITIEDFKAVGEEGSVDLIGEGDDAYTFSLARWIEVDQKILDFGPKETKVIRFKINIPKNAEPGGRYASLVINMETGTNVSGGAAVTPRVVSLVMLRVSGNVEEKAEPISFEAVPYGNSVDFVLRVKNNGANHIKPKGTIVVHNLLGRKVAEIPLSAENVLPGAVRKMITQWSAERVLLGRYNASLVTTYGERGNKPLTASTAFVVFPKRYGYYLVFGFAIVGVTIINKKKIKRKLHQLTK